MLRIAIIGAGPAGSAAAYHLARAGADVTVIERAAFPRVKVCGEFISPGASHVLESIVPAHDLLRTGARRIDRFVLELEGRDAALELGTPAWAISRAALDAILLDRARGAGSKVFQPAIVRAVDYADHGVMLRLGDGRALEADLVIHADGSGRHDARGPVPCDPRLVAFKCHLRVPARGLDGVHIRASAGAYVGTIRVESDLATCALVARKHLIAGADADAMLGALWPEFRHAWRVSDWHSCGVPRSGYVPPGHARSFRIGNAAAAVDPVGGEGIGLALWSGAELARLLAEPARDTRPDEFGAHLASLHARFARAYSRRLRTRLPACRAAAELLMRPALVRSLWPLTFAPALVMRPWYALTGKPVGARV